jgi:hypothetical protein
MTTAAVLLAAFTVLLALIRPSQPPGPEHVPVTPPSPLPGADRKQQDEAARIHQKLATGAPVILVPATGPPRSWVPRAGQDGLKLSTDQAQPFQVSYGSGLGALDLVKDPPCERYALRAEVRHDRDDDYSQVGIYCLAGDRDTVQGKDHCFCAMIFADLGPRAHVPRGAGEWDAEAQFDVCRYSDRGPLLNSLNFRPGLRFRPQHGAWRSLEVRVTPKQFEGWWDGQLVRKIDRDQLQRDVQDSLYPRLPAQDFPGRAAMEKAMAGQRAMALREVLGLWVWKGAASFRNAVVEPIAEGLKNP